MRYQVIITTRSRRRWLRPDKPLPDLSFGSSEGLVGALHLLQVAPFHAPHERVVVVDTEDGRWLAIKRGRVEA